MLFDKLLNSTSKLIFPFKRFMYPKKYDLIWSVSIKCLFRVVWSQLVAFGCMVVADALRWDLLNVLQTVSDAFIEVVNCFVLPNNMLS